MEHVRTRISGRILAVRIVTQHMPPSGTTQRICPLTRCVSAHAHRTNHCFDRNDKPLCTIFCVDRNHIIPQADSDLITRFTAKLFGWIRPTAFLIKIQLIFFAFDTYIFPTITYSITALLAKEIIVFFDLAVALQTVSCTVIIVFISFASLRLRMPAR